MTGAERWGSLRNMRANPDTLIPLVGSILDAECLSNSLRLMPQRTPIRPLAIQVSVSYCMVSKPRM